MRRLNPDQRPGSCELSWGSIFNEPGPTASSPIASGTELDRQRLPSSYESPGTDFLPSQLQCRPCRVVRRMPCHQPGECNHKSRSASRLGQLEFYQHRKSSGDGWYVESHSLEVFQFAERLLVSIDDHPMWVYAIDGRYIVPQLVDVCFPLHFIIWALTKSSGNDLLPRQPTLRVRPTQSASP